MIKYFLFEKSAVERLVNEPRMQSIEFELSKMFISCLKEGKDFSLNGVLVKNTKNGIIFCGKDISKTFLLIDLEKCLLLEQTSEQELLVVLQKAFRFSVRFWNRQAYTSCEKIFKDRTVIFPFPFSAQAAERIVIARNPMDRRLTVRGINNALLAYKYGQEGTSASTEEIPDMTLFRKGGEDYLEYIPDFKMQYVQQNQKNANSAENKAIHVVEVENMMKDTAFKFYSYEKQLEGLTSSQRKIVECEDMKSPIRIEGPAGTGKTMAMVLRAIHMLKIATQKNESLAIYFFAHSKSTQTVIEMMVTRLADEKWLKEDNEQRIKIITLQEYCINYINLKDTQIIDLDAAEAKQYQLFLIQEAYDSIKGKIFNTFKALMSSQMVDFFEKEEDNKIILMLQYEFSIQIKGIAEGELDAYKKIAPIKNGIPFENDIDKEFVFRIFTEYQQFLESQSVYDTDDIILEALARLNAPLWRRARVREGIDYLFVDEMHLFNLNEQQIFHFLTKDAEQNSIPICFALDYGQTVGERGARENNYIEKGIYKNAVLHQEFGTIFRSSQQIAELCASITASGALLFDNFVNPYKFCESGFTAKEEVLCEVPQLLMYENDDQMQNSLEDHIKDNINKYKCKPGEIAVLFFDESMLNDNFTKKIGNYTVKLINGRLMESFDNDYSHVICALPEYVNGLEFKCVILVGVDEGRVPQSGIYDISSNFLKYSALNKLYLACSRAQFDVKILGSKTRGISSCLKHSIENETLKNVM